MFTFFKSKAEKHKSKLCKLFSEEALREIGNSRDKNVINQKLTKVHSKFRETETYRKYSEMSRREGWDIYDTLRDEEFVLIAMLTQGLSRSAAENSVKLFKKMTGW